MAVSIIVNVVLLIVIAALYAYNIYKTTGLNIYKKIAFLIKEANNLDLLGSEKMDSVVDKLYDLVPKVYKEKLTKELLRKKAQKVYNVMKDFSESEKNKEK